jgi:hypothetical protein
VMGMPDLLARRRNGLRAAACPPWAVPQAGPVSGGSATTLNCGRPYRIGTPRVKGRTRENAALCEDLRLAG